MVFTIIILGILVGILISVLIIKSNNTDNKFKTDYDERQEAIRGRGYKYAAYTAWALLGFLVCTKLAEINLHMDDALVAFLILVISLLVQTIHAVMNDAYFGSNNDRRKYIVFFVIIAMINLASAAAKIISGEMIVDGTVSWVGINAICGLMFVILGIALVVKNIVSKKEEEEEE